LKLSHHSALARHNWRVVRLGSHRDQGKTGTPSFPHFPHVNLLHFPPIYLPFLCIADVIALVFSPDVYSSVVVGASILFLRAKSFALRSLVSNVSKTSCLSSGDLQRYFNEYLRVSPRLGS
jgi:hypothetical protein